MVIRLMSKVDLLRSNNGEIICFKNEEMFLALSMLYCFFICLVFLAPVKY